METQDKGQDKVAFPPNWTQNFDGRENSSDAFLALVDEVARLLRGGGQCLSPVWAEHTARLILAQLAHVHGLAPSVPA